MQLRRLIAFLALLALAVQSHAQSEPVALDLRVGFARNAAGEIELTAELENRGTEAISLPLQFAPWAVNAMEIVVRRVNARAELVPQGIMIADYPRNRVRLGPGERRGGRFLLTHVAKESSSQLQETDLVVFWYWQPRLSEPDYTGKPLHGTLYIPRK